MVALRSPVSGLRISAFSLQPLAFALLMSYVVITPVRNEADHLAQTIESMAAQTLPPALWVIV